MCKKICLLIMTGQFTSLWYKDPGWNTHPVPSLSRRASKEDRARFSSAGRRNCYLSKEEEKKKKHKEADNSNDPIEEEENVVDPNSISTSDAETEDGAEP